MNIYEASLSLLERYFCRPQGAFTTHDGTVRSFDSLSYTEYWSQFRTQKYDANNDGRDLFYRELPNTRGASQLHVVQRGPTVLHISRLQPIRPSAGEVFYLRALLQHRAARSFDDIRTSSAGTCLPTFQEAASEAGLFAHDNEAQYAITEAIEQLRTPSQLRVLFVHLLVNDCVPEPMLLWELFHVSLAKDHILRLGGNEALGINRALGDLARYLEEYGKTLQDYGLPGAEIHSHEVQHELERWGAQAGSLATLADAAEHILNNEQREIYDEVLNAVAENKPLAVFVDGKAGRGKTYMVNAICNRLRSQGRLVLATATSAFAAQLYPGGRTTHSTFKVPVNDNNELLESPVLAGSSRGDLIQHAALIIWDEAPMVNRA